MNPLTQVFLSSFSSPTTARRKAMSASSSASSRRSAWRSAARPAASPQRSCATVARPPPAAGDSPALTAALIACAQKIEHQEIASYGCLREWAVLLGSKETAGLIEELLDQEKTANQALIKLAKFRCNPEALDETAPTSTSSDRFGHEIVGSAAPFQTTAAAITAGS